MVKPTKDKERTTTEKTGKRKWLGRLGTFLIMGGWIIILVLVVGIWITVAILTKGC